MTDIDLDQLGPVDYMVVGFPSEKANFSGAMADELKKKADSPPAKEASPPKDAVKDGAKQNAK